MALEESNRSSTSLALLLGALSGWLGHIVGIGCTFFLTPVILSGLGAYGYGIWSLIVTVTRYYGLADIGIGTATTKFLAKHVAEGEQEKAEEIVGWTMRTYLKLGGLVLALSIAVGLAIPAAVELETISKTDFLITAFLLGGNAVLILQESTFRSYLRANKAFTSINLVGILAQTASAIGVGMVVLAGHGILMMAAVLLVVGLARCLMLWSISQWKFQFPLKAMTQRSERGRELVSFGIMVVTARLIGKISQKIGTLSGIWLGGPVMVAYYSLAETACEKSLGLITPIRQMIVPTASATTADSSNKSQQRLISLAPRIFLAVGLGLSAALSVYGERFLELWIGAELAGHTWPVLAILMWTIPCRALASCFGLLLQGFGKVVQVTWIAIGEGLLLALSVIILCSIMGGIGLAWGVLLTMGVSSLCIMPWFVAKYASIPYRQLMLSVTIPAVITGGIGWGVAFMLAAYHPPDSYLDIGLQGSCVASVGGVAAFFLCADELLRRTVIQGLLSRLPFVHAITGPS